MIYATISKLIEYMFVIFVYEIIKHFLRRS